jgi:hypothetical protein
MVFDNDADEFLGESDSSDFHRSKESPNNLRLRNPISTMSESSDVEMPQSQQTTKEDSKRKSRSNMTCCSSTKRNISQIARFLSPCIRLANRHRAISIIFSLILGIILYLHFKQVHMRYMGKHALHGGRIGQRIDAFFTRNYARSVYERRKMEFKETGVDFPDLLNVDLAGILELQTNDALREVILRGENTAKQLQTLENNAEEYASACLSGAGQSLTIPSVLPRHMFVPDHHAMLYPVPNYLSRIPFRAVNMRSFIKVNYNSLLIMFDSLGTLVERTNLWALVMVYHFGGVYIGNHTNAILLSSTKVLQALFQNQPQRFDEHCRKPTVVLAYAEEPESAVSHDNSALALIAATPRHPHLKCVLEQLTTGWEAHGVQKITPGLFFDSSALSDGFVGNFWTEFTIQTTDSKNCSVPFQHRLLDGIKDLADGVIRTDAPPRVFATVWQPSPADAIAISSPKVSISEETRLDTSNRHRKQPLRTLMKSRGIEPGWLCARCLRAPVMGTLQKCTLFCPTEYADLICKRKKERAAHIVDVHIGSAFQQEIPFQPRIPRIVHQTWFEEISLQEYPQLARLQNSWMNSGWEYRFYDDKDASDYIDKNFPRHFREAYDALVPGAFKVGEKNSKKYVRSLLTFISFHRCRPTCSGTWCS